MTYVQKHFFSFFVVAQTSTFFIRKSLLYTLFGHLHLFDKVPFIKNRRNCLTMPVKHNKNVSVHAIENPPAEKNKEDNITLLQCRLQYIHIHLRRIHIEVNWVTIYI